MGNYLRHRDRGDGVVGSRSWFEVYEDFPVGRRADVVYLENLDMISFDLILLLSLDSRGYFQSRV